MKEFKEIELPSRDTWEAGLVSAVAIAENFVRVFDDTKQVLTINAEQRGKGIPTTEEVKMALSLLVARRMVIEAQADLAFNTIAVAKSRRLLMGHNGVPMAVRQDIVQKLATKEGLGLKITQGWRVMEQGLKRWQSEDYWKHRKPWIEARKLFYAIQGLEGVPINKGAKHDNEDQRQGEAAGSSGPEQPTGQQADPGKAGHQGEADRQGKTADGQAGSPRSEDPGHRAGPTGRKNEGVQGVQEATRQED